MAVTEMAEYMQTVGERPAELSVEVRYLLSVAYRSAVGRRRVAWRIITSVEQKEKTKGNEQQELYEREYVAEEEAELQKICDGILAFMDNNLIPLARTEESKVLDYKVKGDHYRHLADCAKGDAESKKFHPGEVSSMLLTKMRETAEAYLGTKVNDAVSKAAVNARVAFAEDTKVAEKDLVVTHPIRVSLTLNFSVFRYEVFHNPDEACKMACAAFEDDHGPEQREQEGSELPGLRGTGLHQQEEP